MKEYLLNAAESDNSRDSDNLIVGDNDKQWVLLGLSWVECHLIGERGLDSQELVVEKVNSLAKLVGPEVNVVVVLSPGLVRLFEQSTAALFHQAQSLGSSVTILVPWKEPPTLSVRFDGLVSSFWCTASVFHELLAVVSIDVVDDLCFNLLSAILNGGVDVQRLFVKQLPLQSARELPPADHTGALIMAHRGASKYLEVALTFLQRAASFSMLSVRVGLDTQETDEYQAMLRSFQNIEFYKVSPAPAGPYVIRQQLVELSSEGFLVFQDSDDISCYDRFIVQQAEMRKTKADLIGCHQLRVDEIERRVEAFRFPLDVSAALSATNSASLTYQAKEPLLHATAMVVRQGFVNAGGFSTDQKIANDTQFMLRAYFTLQMRNVDSFLYIQRRHSRALTVAKATALDTPLRRSLGSRWAVDFEAVKDGRALLDMTSLAPRPGAEQHSLTPLCVDN
jgi:hypothetical protein